MGGHRNHPNVRPSTAPIPVTLHSPARVTHRMFVVLTRFEHVGFHDSMQHEFTHVGSNAILSSHVCDVCGLVVSLAKSQPSGALPLDGCLIRSDVPPALSQWPQP